MDSSSTLWSNWGQRFRLIAFLMLGATFATLHHLLGKYLSGKPVLAVSISGTRVDQSLVGITSNALSQVIKWLVAGTIGVAFAQHFWIATIKYHDREYWSKLDAPLAASKGNPFTFSALPTWRRTPGLAFTALMIMSMVFIPILVPGSIRVVTGQLTQRCSINAPDITNAFLASMVDTSINTIFPTSRTSAIVNSVILGGSYLQVPSPCSVCSYRLNFTAPSMNCSDATDDTYDFSTKFPLQYRNDIHWTPFWNGTLSALTDEGYVLTVATRGGQLSTEPYLRLITHPPAVVKCYAYNTDYSVQIQHDNFSSRIDVLDAIPRSRLSPTFRVGVDGFPDDLETELGGLVQAVVLALRGIIVYDILNDGFVDTNLTVAYSSMLHWTNVAKTDLTNYTRIARWSDLSTSLPSLMQNVSLSLISGQFDSLYQPYMTKVDTDCALAGLLYDYDSRRLVGIYAAAWTVAAIYLLLGLLFIWWNEGEHTLDFSHLVEQLN